MSLSHYRQEDSTSSLQHETSLKRSQCGEGAKPDFSRPQLERSDMIKSTITVLVKATLGISEHTSTLNRSQPSRPVVIIDRIVLVSICMLVVLGFCVPIIIYALDTDKSAAKITLNIDVDQCTTYQVSFKYDSYPLLMCEITVHTANWLFTMQWILPRLNYRTVLLCIPSSVEAIL